MAHYNIFREQLATKYPAFGHALWDPEPRNPDRPTQVGDVGFIRTGKFYRLFNALLPADDPSQEFGVPEYYEPLSPSLLKHVDKGTRSPSNYCSAGVCVEDIPAHYSNSPYESDFRRTSFRYSRTRGAAVLSLPVTTQREDTIAQGAFGRWIVTHIGSWLAFAQKLELGIEEMEEIILVTGCDLTRSWTNVAFLGGEVDAQVSFGVDVRVEDSKPDIKFQLSPALVRGAVIDQGPEGKNLPENQCVFLRGFRVARSFWPLPKHLKAAAGPSPDPGGHGGSDCDPNIELVSTPNTKYRDPLRLIQDYIVEQVPDCDMVLIHDNDLMMIDGIGCRGTSLETLEPDVVMDHLWRSNIQVHEVMCESSPTDSPSGRNADMTTVKVAMLSKTFQNWNAASPFQWPPVAQNINIGYTSELRGIPPHVVSDSSPVPTTVQSAPMESCLFQIPVEPLMTDTTSPSQWSSLAVNNIEICHTIESRGTSPLAVSDSLPVPSIVLQPGRPYSHQPTNEHLIADTGSPFQWSPLAAKNVHIGHTSESRGAPPPAVSGGLLVSTIAQNAAGKKLPPENAVGGSYSRQSANEPHPTHSFDFIHAQHQGFNTATCGPSQGPHASTCEYTLGKSYSPKHSIVRHTKRRALLIGINYCTYPDLNSDPAFKLNCTENAHGMAHFICTNLGFARHDVRLMTDEADDPRNLPTKDNIIVALRALVTDAKPGDSFFFYYSGHAKHIKDLDRDEPDGGRDECICAIDYRGNVPNPNPNTPGLIVDDVIHNTLVRPLPQGCRLTALFDSCHSGTALDLPYQYDSHGVVKPSTHQDKVGLLRQKLSYADVISLSASPDNQKAGETWQGGALRFAFIECVGTTGHTLTYRELLRRVREYMRRHGFPQRPQLSTSYEIDTNLQFTTLGETSGVETGSRRLDPVSNKVHAIEPITVM